jgi:polysaccharide deacetylase family protein (PEP-CTERM system associated)
MRPEERAGERARTLNALTIDVEDYYHVSAFERVVPRADWERLESRVRRNTDRLLALLEEADTRATFFVLGWVAERYPSLVRDISRAGHEVASHGYGHRLVYDQSPREFANDIRRAKAVLESVTGRAVLGYRAPSFSITRKSWWAFDVLAQQGYVYDASVYPIHHDRYGVPDAPRHVHPVQTSTGCIWEVPGSTVRLGGTNLPVAGGGYFRMLPYGWTRWGVNRINRHDGQPAIFYIHPWEVDPGQPRFPAPLLTRFRHYANLSRTEARFRRLLRDFSFGSVAEILNLAYVPAQPAPARIPFADPRAVGAAR